LFQNICNRCIVSTAHALVPYWEKLKKLLESLFNSQGAGKEFDVMDKPHKEVRTTYPVAIKKGQERIHVRGENLIPWHARADELKCPKCDAVYIASSNYPSEDLLLEMLNHHRDQLEHPDYVASAPAWTHIRECNCENEALDKGAPETD
jgi:hypothetical protein